MAGLMTASYPMLNLGDRTIKKWPTMAEAFKLKGYRTAAFHSNPWLSQMFGFETGFDDFQYIVPNRRTEDIIDVGPLAKRIPIAIDEFLNITIRYSPAAIRARPLFDQAKRWLKTGDKTKPFFLWIHPMDVHFPYAYPASALDRIRPARILGYGLDFLSRYTENSVIRNLGSRLSLVREYNSSIQYVDEVLGDFLGQVPEDTVIAVLSDHGELFGEHGLQGHPGCLYNEIIRVPALVYSPNEQRRTLNANHSMIELKRVLSELALGNSPFEPAIKYPLSIHLDYKSKIRRTSVVDQNWKLIVTEHLSEKREEKALFDLSRDPRESLNVASSHHDIVDRLSSVRLKILRDSEMQRLRLSVSRLPSVLNKKS